MKIRLFWDCKDSNNLPAILNTKIAYDLMKVIHAESAEDKIMLLCANSASQRRTIKTIWTKLCKGLMNMVQHVIAGTIPNGIQMAFVIPIDGFLRNKMILKNLKRYYRITE